MCKMEGIRNMNTVKQIRVGDVCQSISDTYRANAKKVVLINTSDVLEGEILNHTEVPNEGLKGQFKKTFKKDDILYSEIRPQNKRFAFVEIEPHNYIASTKLMVLRSDKTIVLPKYLYYYLKSEQVINELQALAETRSGTFPQITFTELSQLKILLPSLSIQKKIVSILESVENKISLNNKINNNLEQQAKTLYNQMFLSSTSDNWIKGVLSDIADITMGQSPSGDSYNEVGIGTVFFQGRAEFGYRFPTKRLYTTEPKRMAQKNDILMSVRAPVGDMNVALEDCCIGRGLASIRSKDNHQSFILYTMFTLQTELDKFNGEGTVFGSINRDSLNKLPLIIPSNDAISQFESIVVPMDAQICANHEENLRLKSIRDTLLPKLMSGEIDLSGIDI